MTKNVETLLDYFSQIRKVYAEWLKIKYKGHYFSPNEIDILILLANNRSINNCGQLNLLLKVSKGLISRSISSLEDRGRVSTWESEDDKRVRRISLTDEAGPVIDQLNRGIREINEIVLFDISEEEIRQMEETMEKIMRNFKAAEEEYL